MSAQTRRRWLIVSGLVMVAFWVAMSVIERRLPASRPGIIEFEFVRNSSRAARFLSEWGPDGRETVRLLLWLDYGFMLGYGAFVTLAGLATRDFARERGLRRLAGVGRVVPWFAAAAALFDACENAFLLLIVGEHWGRAAPVLATTCSSIKWALITIAVAYVAWGARRQSQLLDEEEERLVVLRQILDAGAVLQAAGRGEEGNVHASLAGYL